MSTKRNDTTAMVNPDHPDAVTETVVGAVANAEGMTPLDLEPLATVIDPEALGMIVRTGMDVTVGFTYHGFQVSVSGDGRVNVKA